MRLGTRLSSRSGLGLLVVVVMLSVVALVAATIALRAQKSMQAQSSGSRAVAGEDTAYSGLQAALAGVTQDSQDWSGASGRTPMPQRPSLSYRHVVNNNFDSEDPIIDADGTEIPAESIYVKSLAYADGKLTLGMSAVVAQQRGMTFNYPAFGSEGIDLTNTLMQAVESDGTPAAGDAPIRVNAQDADSIVLRGGSFVDGDVTVGPGGDPLIALRAETGSGFSGEADTAGAALPLPEVPANYDPSAPSIMPVCIPLPIPLPPSGGIAFLNMTVMVVPPGTYNEIHIKPADNVRLYPELAHFSMLTFQEGEIYCNNLVSSGDERVEVYATGTSIVHVKEAVTFDAATTVMMGSTPGALQIYQTDEDGTVDLNRTIGSFVLAAQAEVRATQSTLVGAVYGKKISMTDSAVVYPKELDGKVLNEKIRGSWRLFGTRTLTPSQAAQADTVP